MQFGFADPVGEEAELSDAHEARGEHVQQERRRNSTASSVMSFLRARCA
jgi:hypothetical protein